MAAKPQIIRLLTLGDSGAGTKRAMIICSAAHLLLLRGSQCVRWLTCVSVCALCV